jgi:O-antigen ligase
MPAAQTSLERVDTGIKWWRPAAPRAASGSALLEGKRGRLAFASAVVFTAVLLLAPQQRFPFLEPLHLAATSGGLAILAHLRDRLSQRLSLVSGRESWLAAALLAWALATMPLSIWPGGSVRELSAELGKSLGIFWLLGGVLDTRARLRQFAWALTLLAIPLALTAVQNLAAGVFLGAAQLPAFQRIDGYQAPLTANPNDLALMLNLILPLSCALFLTSRGWARLLLAFAIGLDGVAVVATFSRAGAMTMVLILAGFAWKMRRRTERSWVWGALLLGLLCCTLLPAGYMDRLSTITDVSSDPTGSAQQRFRDSLTALKLVAENPIVGSGLGMGPLALNAERGATWLQVHNVYLQHAVDLGLPGLALFVLLLVACIRGAGQVQRQPWRRASDELFQLAQGIQLALIGFALAGFFHPAGYHFYFYYLGGLAVAARRIASRESPEPHPVPSAKWPSVVGSSA